MYQAIVSSIKVKPHENADKLQIGFCHGFQVVIGLNVQDGELGVFFPTDGQLSNEFCIANDLYPRFDTEGNRTGGGFIDPKNRRIRSQNFRGVKSDGFWVPISYFNYLGEVKLKEGQTFTELKGESICNKYINPATQRAIDRASKQGTKKITYRETPLFPMHEDTKQLKYFIDQIPVGSTVYITEKLHGTSGRTANAPTPETDISFLWQRIRKAYEAFRGIEKDRYKTLTGSRRVIKDAKPQEQGYYGNDDFRYAASKELAPFLRKGEAIYYEIVGFAGNTSLMPSVDNKVVGKDFVKSFGKTTNWTYGCPPGQYKIYIYNWMLSSEDGHHYSYPWEYITKRCEKFGLHAVPKLSPQIELIPDHIRNLDRDKTSLANMLVKNPRKVRLTRGEISTLVNCQTEDRFSTLDSHLREGVCLRVEHQGQIWGTFKNKAQSFGILEGYIKTNEEYVDAEELESYQ